MPSAFAIKDTSRLDHCASINALPTVILTQLGHACVSVDSLKIPWDNVFWSAVEQTKSMTQLKRNVFVGKDTCSHEINVCQNVQVIKTQ